jgi:hypothetical protein
MRLTEELKERKKVMDENRVRAIQELQATHEAAQCSNEHSLPGIGFYPNAWRSGANVWNNMPYCTRCNYAFQNGPDFISTSCARCNASLVD